MKKLIPLMMVLVLSVMALAGCGGSGEAGSAAGDSADAQATLDSLKTIGDVAALESDLQQTSVTNGHVVYVFQLGDTYYRAIASISPEDEQAYYDIDFEDEDFMEQQEAIVAPLEIEEIQNVSEMIPPQEELDKWVGKTGAELEEAGWYYSGYNLEDEIFWMGYGPFKYNVTFDGDFSDVDIDTFDEVEATKDLKVTSVTFDDIGDATDLGEE